MNDEVTQVMGVTHVGDLTNISPAYLTLFSPSEFATIIKWGEVNFTIKHNHIVTVYILDKYLNVFWANELKCSLRIYYNIFNFIDTQI